MNFIIWIPLFGLWFALLFIKSKRKETSFQYGMVIHLVWLLYFVASSAGILLVGWVIPYFLGSFGEIVFRIHTVFALTGYLVLMGFGLWKEPIMARWFEKSMSLKKIQNYLFLG